MKTLLAEIERVLPDGGSWCELSKASTLAALIVGLRPQTVVELGVWQGGSFVPMALALKRNGAGRAIAIDPWASAASVVDQNETNAQWWGSTDHSAAYRKFIGRLEVLDLTRIVDVWRKTSDECDPPECQLLHIDGNHGPTAIRDVERFAARVTIGGILCLDDVDWSGGHVRAAWARAQEMGFADIGPIGTGMLMQRRSLG